MPYSKQIVYINSLINYKRYKCSTKHIYLCDMDFYLTILLLPIISFILAVLF